jgi:hypothetical protein
MSANQAKKGKLELMLDEFTEVHGTVLMGMHKEVQTLKDEIDKRVEQRITEVLTKVAAEDSKLQSHLEAAEQFLANLDGKERRATTAITTAKNETLSEIELLKDAVLAEGAVVRNEFKTQEAALQELPARINDALGSLHRQALAHIDANKASWEQRANEIKASLVAVDASWNDQAESIRTSLLAIETTTRDALQQRQKQALEDLHSAQRSWVTEAQTIEASLRTTESFLRGDLEEAKRQAVSAIIDQQWDWNAATEKAVKDFSGFQTALNTHCFELEGKLSEQQQENEKRLQESASATQSTIDRIRQDAVSDLETLVGEVKTQRTELYVTVQENKKNQSSFQSDIAQSMEQIGKLQQDHLTKISASLSAADKLNTDTQAILQDVTRRTEELHQRELSLQKRTRQTVIGLGLSIVSTLGVWIWLTLPR